MRFRWVVLGLTTLMQLGVSLPQQTPAALGPVLTPALHLSRAELGLLTSAIWGGMLLGMLPTGMLADRFGERKVIAAGGLGLALFMLLAARTHAFLPLFGVLLLASVGAASGSPGGTRAIAAWFPAGQRGLAMGVRQTGVTAAGVVAALVLPPIAVAFGWQAAFSTVAGLALLTVATFALLYREPAAAGGPPPAGFHAGLLLRNRTFLFATLFGWIFMGALGCSVTYLAVSLHEQAGLSAVQAGLFLAVLQVGGIAGRIGWGVLSDRLGSRGLTMLMTGGLAVVACLAMAQVRGAVAVPLLVGLCFLLGLSTMGWNALYITLTAEAVPVHRAATAIGAGTTVTFIGMFAVTPVFGAIADGYGYGTAWLALAGWTLLGTLVALAVRDQRPGLADHRRGAAEALGVAGAEGHGQP